MVVAAVVTSLLTISPGGAAGKPPAPAEAGRAPQGQARRAVTLISGDRVTVDGKGKLAITPRAGVRYLRYTSRGHQYVIPTDALALLRSDRIDRRLFDITALLEARYDKRELSLIVSGVPRGTKALAASGVTVTRQLPAVRGYAAKAPKEALAGYWKSLKASAGSSARAAGKVWLDAVRKQTLDVSVPQIGAPTAWAAGFDGTGVTVAVLDTGIDATHPDLAGKVTAARNFVTEEDALDRVGHGTHVASTIAGSGAASGGKYKGVAPGAKLLDGKVCFAFGCDESWILAGMQWAAESGARVVNMSLGGSDGPEIDPLEQAVNDLTTQYGTLFVIAAGNSGADETIGSPSSADAALSVGAVTKTEELAEFSSRGPRTGDFAVKPEITAPGVAIVAANSKDGFLGEPGQPYTTLSGTSMATPHTAGAAAILTQRHPDWSPQLRKAALIAAAVPNPQIGPFGQGSGRVDVARAITQSVTTTPAVISLGLQEWPHSDDPVLTRTVSYHNSGASPVTLQLALDTSAPAGMFVLSATTVTVPAGGDATVTLTTDTRGGTETGYFGGRIVATAGGARVLTPFAVVREEQKYKVTLSHTDRSGAPTSNYLTVAINVDTGRDYVVFGTESAADLRLPGGNYLLFSWIDESAGVTSLIWPQLTVNADQSIAIDARKAGGFDVTVPDEAALPAFAAVDVQVTHADSGFGITTFADSFARVFAGQLGPASVPGVLSWASGLFARPGPGGDLDNSPATYLAAWYDKGRVINGLTKHLAKRDLAAITANHAQHSTGAKGFKGSFALVPGANGGSGALLLFDLPFTRTEYLTTATGWQHSFDEVTLQGEGFPEFIAGFSSGPKTYKPGRSYREQWNKAVFGPTFPATGSRFDWVSREADTIYVDAPLFGDSSGRAGFGAYTSARTALYRNGALVKEVSDPFAFFEVPAGRSDYRIESTVERGVPAVLSTKVHTVWTFSSKHTDKAKPLPVTGIGFAPPVDDRNTIAAGGLAVIGVTAWQQEQSGAGKLRRLTVEVSFDDGKTWRKAPVLRIFNSWLLLVAHPNKAGFVSLRAQGSDVAGNTVDQTVIRAYQLTAR